MAYYMLKYLKEESDFEIAVHGTQTFIEKEGLIIRCWFTKKIYQLGK